MIIITGPGSKLSGQVKTNVIIGSTVGGVVLVLFLLFMVYMLRYRRMRTSCKKDSRLHNFYK